MVSTARPNPEYIGTTYLRSRRITSPAYRRVRRKRRAYERHRVEIDRRHVPNVLVTDCAGPAPNQEGVLSTVY
jgi:hypothetical protein